MHSKKEVQLKKLAKILNAHLSGNINFIVNDVSEPETADEKSIIYLSAKKYIRKINNSKAKVVLTSKKLPLDQINNKILLISDNLEESFIKLIDFFQFKEKYDYIISKKASIHISAKVSDRIHIEDYAIVGANSEIKEGTVICPFVFIGKNVSIGKNCLIYPNVSIYDETIIGNNVTIHSGTVIGSDGFGYSRKNKKSIKIPQIGNVIIEDDVEIGSNTSIDRSTIGSTIIRKGVKIDNMVQIAHNVEIGENTIIASQSGISGSSKIGSNCILAGQVGVADHAIVEDDLIIGAKSGIPSTTIKSKEKMLFGVPARSILKAKRIEAIISKLPDIYQEFIELKKKINK